MKKRELPGGFRAEIYSAFPENILNSCAARGITVFGAEYRGPCCIQISVLQKHEAELRDLCRRSAAEINILSYKGGRKTGNIIRARMPLIIIAGLISIFLLTSSFFIWDIELCSDGEINEAQILKLLSRYGLDTGSFWPGIDTDILRAQVLSDCRELSWMTVNISGSRARVILKTQEELPEIYDSSCPADIRAVRQGKILSMQIFNGVSHVSPGDEVGKGQLLIGSYAESLSNPPRFIRAKGNIKAETRREITAVCPRMGLKKTSHTRRRTRWALKIGKKRVNFYFNSGKYIDGCDKIIKEYNLGVEGLFALPLGLVREELIFFTAEEDECFSRKTMETELMRRLSEDTDGKILKTDIEDESGEELLILRLRASCIEEIGEITERHNP